MKGEFIKLSKSWQKMVDQLGQYMLLKVRKHFVFVLYSIKMTFSPTQ